MTSPVFLLARIGIVYIGATLPILSGISTCEYRWMHAWIFTLLFAAKTVRYTHLKNGLRCSSKPLSFGCFESYSIIYCLAIKIAIPGFLIIGKHVRIKRYLGHLNGLWQCCQFAKKRCKRSRTWDLQSSSCPLVSSLLKHVERRLPEPAVMFSESVKA